MRALIPSVALGLLCCSAACTQGAAPAQEEQRAVSSAPAPAAPEGQAAAKEKRAASNEGDAAERKAEAPSPEPAAASGPGQSFGSGGKGLGGGGRAMGGLDTAPAAKKPRPRAPGPRDESGLQPAAPPPVRDFEQPRQGGAVADSPRLPDPLVEAPMDANGRFVTTYRPGGGHLAAFESAVARGIVPAGERELVSDIGARYAPSIDPPAEGALSYAAHFERAALGPTGGPVHVRLALRSTTQAAKERPRLSVSLVIDTSGSMRGELIQSARQAATALVDKLAPGDDFSLITFSTDAKVLVPMGTIGARRDAVKKTISEIREGGGTNIGEGLRLGYAELGAKSIPEDTVKVTLLLSDGRANDGITNRGQLSKLALDAFQTGIQTSALGLGTDYDGPLMSQIANDGAGGYYYLRDGAQIAPALATELDKRLDPVATALEIRVRLKPGVELLNAYGSRRLSQAEAERVRTIEVAADKQAEQRDGIKQNRKDDVEGGMRFLIPAFARDDAHAMLLKLRLPEGVGKKDVAMIELKYKDRLTKKNVVEELPLSITYATSDAESARTIDASVARTVQGFAAGEALMKAAQLVAQNKKRQAIDLLGEREGILHHAATSLGEPLFVQDAQRLARLRLHAAGSGELGEPLVLAMMMETAGNVHLR